eukprot:CAMPEP_0173395782 /NCGR_PEP_ID=MMETSP1356-20130122/33345_1 /TAXON_ID=77927 ORGANISM="Hemiselmis virescens, Strain PCC157" /NCGR_SAMPLE_ID=MMETSP1356 /ASSEMBLY_ACC=CAM_ASM_000847 /LENGTH=262 /DNA_ID=CAMNT_0014354633 /DNA_START=110 /DNA_END=898 /DNA_ORIENTATION=+
MSADPATAENLRLLRSSLSGSETGLQHHSDRSLSRFLRSKKTVDKAAALVLAYDAFVSEKGWQNLTFADVEKTFENKITVCCPDMRDREGRTIVWTRIGNFNKNTMKPEDVQKLMFFTMDWLTTTYERVQKDGVVIVGDWTGFSMFNFTPALPKLILHTAQNILPIRLKAACHVNQASFFNVVFGIITPFMGAKFRSRIRLMKDMDDLRNVVDNSMIPTEMGGQFSFPYDQVRDLMGKGKSHTDNPLNPAAAPPPQRTVVHM